MRKKMELIELQLPPPYAKDLDILVEEKFYPNREEAIRVAIRDLIKEDLPIAKKRKKEREYLES